VRLARLALQERAPLVLLLEGAGERTSNALEGYPHAPNDLQELARLSGRVPTVAAVMGASAGHGALCAVLADFVVMVDGAALFSAGPKLVLRALGERVTKEELGGARMHAAESGNAHNLAADDAEALALVRRYLSYFPSSAWEWPPRSPSGPDAAERRLDDALERIPREPTRPYDIRPLLEELCDAGSLLEIQPWYGESIVTALARLGGEPVACVASQPQAMAGAVTRHSAEKAAHFLEVADAFHLPVVFLADNPGILAGVRAEQEGTLRAAARMYAAQARLRSPKLHVTLRKAYGFGSSLMGMNPFDGQTLCLALPGASLAALPAAGGSDAAGLDASARERLAEAEAAGAWLAADTLGYDDVIDPRDLRNALLAGLRLAAGRRGEAPAPVRSIRP
jgi:methylmalonyl-CoA decarboxylase subunit alpha